MSLDTPDPLETLRDALPPYARDLALNLATVAGEEHLTVQQKWGCFVACAYAVGVGPVVKAVEGAAAQAGLSEEVQAAAKLAAAMMGMNNVYFRSAHQLGNHEIRTLPTRLRMNMIANPGAPRVDFELWELAVSAINGCDACLRKHEAELAKREVPLLAVQAAIRIAAVVNAVSRVLAAEAART